MGTQNKVLVEQWSKLRVAGRGIGLFAAPAYVEQLAEAPWPLVDMPIAVHGISANSAIAPDILAKLAVAVIEVDPADPRSLTRLVDAIRSGSGATVIAAIAHAEMPLIRTLLREGVADVVTLPLNLDELAQVTLEALARASARDPGPALAPMIAVVRSNSGCGATTVATHLAAEIGNAGWSGMPILADLDLQFGAAAYYLGIKGFGSFLDLLSAHDRLDDALVASAANEVGSFSVIAAPHGIVPIERVEVDPLLRCLQAVRAQYGLAILDLPASWTNWSLSAISASDLILVVTELSVASLRQARRTIDLFDTIGIDPSRVRIVVNRVEKRLFKTISIGDVSDTLGRQVIGQLAIDEATLSHAQERGLLASQIARKSPFARDIVALAQAVHALLVNERA